MINSKICILVLLLMVSSRVADAHPATSIADFGAVSDGLTNASSAFARALASGATSIDIPPGVYLVGPETLQVPPNVTLHGSGASSVLKLAPATATLFAVSANDRLEMISFVGTGCKAGGPSDPGIINASAAGSGSSFRSLKFDDCDRSCIALDHADDVSIDECKFNHIGLAVNMAFTHRIRIGNNSIRTARCSAIQFWGNEQWRTKGMSDIQILGNYVKDGGEGVWGTGASRVIMANNIVDGSTDVGLDLEWCDDSVISGNTVRNCANAEISLFYSCKHIAITGNTCINDGPITDPKAEWYVRSGIWLTYPNIENDPNDTGHQDVSIVGNTVFCASDAPRRAIWIGSEADNITLASNTLDGGAIWKDGVNNVHPMVLHRIDDNTVVHRANHAPLPLK